ncbi:unnamed protein product, partial [Urochloa humidicola]
IIPQNLNVYLLMYLHTVTIIFYLQKKKIFILQLNTSSKKSDNTDEKIKQLKL